VCSQRQKEKEIYLLASSNTSEDKKAALETETAEMKVSVGSQAAALFPIRAW
jgi:hypothetical protein